MSVLEIIIAALAVYVVLLLLLETVLWRVQPDIENVVTLFVEQDGSTFARKLFGFEHEGRLYVSSNHWFRQWYHAVLENPTIDVDRAGERTPHVASPVEGAELAEVAREYKMGFMFGCCADLRHVVS